MSFYNTGNPVPSIDPRDLDDNAKILDEFVNSTEETYSDRKGVERKTLFGIENDASSATLRSDLAASSGADLVGFIQGGAGSAALTSTEKLRQSVSVLDFGVVLNSTASASINLLAINAAITYLSGLGGGTLLFPEGAIYISRPDGATLPEQQYILLKKGVYLVGKSKLSTRIVRYGPHSILNMVEGQDNSDISVQSMTLDGNPGAVGFSDSAANLAYVIDGNGITFSNVLFKNCPGLHGIDVNGSKNVFAYKCDFYGHDLDLSVAFGGVNYFPESVQVGKHPTTAMLSERVVVDGCNFGPSADYIAPLVAVGNHSALPGSGYSARDVTIKNCRATGIRNYFTRPLAWDTVLVENSRSVSSAGMFCLMGGSTVSSVITPSKDITLRNCYFDGNSYFYRCDPNLILYPSVERYSGVIIDRCEVVGRSSIDAISLFYCDDVTITGAKIVGAARGLRGQAITNLRIVNPSFSAMSVSGVEIVTVAESVDSLSKDIDISGGYIRNTNFYAVNLAFVDGFNIHGVDVTGSSMTDATRGPILISSASKNGHIDGLYGRQTSAANQPLYAVTITGGSDITVGQIDVYATGPNVVVTSASGRSFANKQFGFKNAIPTTGTWARGDYMKNTNPAVGSPKGWVCTVAGTPGTWVSEGNL